MENRVVDGIANDHNTVIEKLSENSNGKINDLSTKGDLSKGNVEILYELRFLGKILYINDLVDKKYN